MLLEYIFCLLLALSAWVLVAYLIEVQWGSHVDVFYPEIGLRREHEPSLCTRLAPREFWGRFVPLLLPLIGGALLLANWEALRG